MFRQIIRFFRRVFQSKGLRTTARVVFWILAGYFLFTYIYAVSSLMRVGLSFREAVTIVFDTVFRPFSRTFLSIVAGIVIGMLGYYRGRTKSTASEEEDKPAETPEPEPAREEEFTETKHYMSR